MPVSLLSTKLYIPRARPDAIARPRLVEKLLDSVNRPGSFALLSGPAGFGKTTLLSEFVAQLQRPVAWLSLDEGDNDPIRFWTYLITACQSVQSEVGDAALALLHTPQPLPGETIPTILINDLARPEGDVVLILDDFHVIHNQSILTAFSFLLDHLPGNLRVVLSSRSDPPWPLGRFRARNQLVEIRVLDLRFTHSEAAAFLNQRMGLRLSVEDVAALEGRTEGWIAGLQLAAIAMQSPLSMQGRSDTSAFIKAFAGSHVYVAEYLIEEVLSQQPENVQTFLLHTSILERLNAGLCETVTGNQDSHAMLTALQRANLFVIPLDDAGEWFRYHHLFADLLQARLCQAVPAEAIAALHGRAAAWYEQHGFAVQSVDHTLAARDFDTAACLVEQIAAAMITRGELDTLFRWVEALPGEVTRRHPLIIIAKAWALTLLGAIRQVEPLLQQVEAQIDTTSKSPAGDELLGNAAAMRAFFAMLAGDYARALVLAERAEVLLPESSIQARSILPYTLGTAYRGQGQVEKAAEAFAITARLGEANQDLLIWATGMTEIINTQRMQGRLHAAVQTGRQALSRMAEQGAQPFGSLAKVEVALCEVLREQNALDEAYRRLTSVIERMQAWDMPTDRLFAYLTLAHVQESRGDFVSALRTWQLAKQVRDSQPVLMFLARSVDISEIRLSLATRDTATAAGLIEDLQPGKSQTVVMREQELILLARVRLAQGKPGEAAAILATLASDAESGGRISALIECLVLQARALDESGNGEAALASLIKALTLGAPQDFVRVFADEGEALRPLLAAAAHQLACTADPALLPLQAYVARLLQAFPGSSLPDKLPQPASDIDSLVEPLTAREVEILRLIAAGDSNQAIADRLFITLSAVKKHAGHIFAKLHVSSRTQAVARARQVGLLPEGD